MSREAPSVIIFKESHRRVARMFAAGWSVKEIQRVTGYSWKRLRILHSTPAFQQLIAEMEPEVMDDVIADDDAFRAQAQRMAIAAGRHIEDKIADLDERGEYLPTKEALAIRADFGDRFGYSKHTKVSHDHSFADLLDRAIERSGQAKLINGETKVVESRVSIPSELVSGSQLGTPKDPPTFSSVLRGQKKITRRV